MPILEQLRAFWPPEVRDNIMLVGGAVRDHLLRMARRDADLVALLSHDTLKRLGFRRVEGISTGPIYVKMVEGIGRIEVTRLDEDDPLEAELRRRDFTVNAMAMRLDGTLVDPLGGAVALHQKRLSACSSESFTADPLRIFRAFRFECAGFTLDDATQKLLQGRDWEPLLKRVPVERFSREMEKVFATEKPSHFFRRMIEYKVGKGYFPELFKMPDIPAGPPEFHPEGDLFTHTMQVLERAVPLSRDPVTRWAVFMHDIGKLATPPEQYPAHHMHDKLGIKLAKEMCVRMRLPQLWVKNAATSSRLHQTAGLWKELRDATKLRLAEEAVRWKIDIRLPIIVKADHGAFDDAEWKRAVAVSKMTVQELGINAKIFRPCRDDDWCHNECPLHKKGKKCPFPKADIPAFVFQRRVEKYRELAAGNGK